MRRTLALAFLLLVPGCGENRRTVPETPTLPASPIPPSGTTWSIGGTVTDALLVVPNARVDVIAGAGAGASTTTGPGGEYQLTGVAGEIELRVSSPGLETQGRRVQVASNQASVNFALVPINPAHVAGSWRLTIEPSGSCVTLPARVRARTYPVVFHQSGARGALTFVDPAVLASNIEAVIYESSVRLAVGLNGYDPKDGFRERLAADTVLAVFGWVPAATLTSSRISGALQGFIGTYSVPADAGLDELLRITPGMTSCSSTDHRFTLER